MSIKFTILGCGSSVGVPRADGFWGNCNPKDSKNYRTRCSAILRTKNLSILIDTSPDLRNQLINNKIINIDKVLYTHMHADQTHGINDLRVFYLKNKKKIDVYADKLTSNYLKNNFSYCFYGFKDYPKILKLNKLKKDMFFYDGVKKIHIKTVIVKHGFINCMSFIINKKCAYASDVSKIHQKDLYLFKKLNFFVVDCLRFQKHSSHFNLDEVLKLVNIIKPKKTILTNLNTELDYNYLLNNLPRSVLPAYDGLSFNIK